MLCQNCHKNEANIHVTELVQNLDESGEPAGQVPQERHLCETCAQTMGLPHTPVIKTPADIWKLLQISAQQKRKQRSGAGPGCPGCGMTVDDFRAGGRMGCPECYATFEKPVSDLLERVHGARRHVGRIPGISEGELDRLHDLAELRRQLEVAIQEEAYEDAARLRDRIQVIEQGLGVGKEAGADS